MTEQFLKVSNLTKGFPIRGRGGRVVRAVSDVNLSIPKGLTVGLVGESGCGKTTLGRMIVGLIEPDQGEIKLKGENVIRARGKELAAFRRSVQMVFQDPYSSLDPRMNVESLVAEPLNVQRIGTRESRRERVKELLELVGISPDLMQRRPAVLSGGQRQRIGIARALALEPELLVLDEPVASLDVSIQAQIINVLRELQQRLKLTYIFISHDLSAVRHICDMVAVMYLGRIVEMGPVETIFSSPAHPYTKALLSAVPRVESGTSSRIVLAGDVANPSAPPSGCAFHPRCWKCEAVCKQERPELVTQPSSDALAACHFPFTLTDASAQAVNLFS